MKATALFVSAMLIAGTCTHAFGQNTDPGPRSRQRAPAQPIDPATDEVLQHIKGAVDPTDEQWAAIIEEYKAFRLEQRSAMQEAFRTMTQRNAQPGQRGEQGQRNGEPGQRDGEPGQRSRDPGPRGGAPGGGQRPDRAAMMERINEAIEPINAAFLSDTKALLDDEQRAFFDSCIADLDLSPAFGRGGRGRPGGGGEMLDPSMGPAEGEKAPAFELDDIEGNAVSLESLLGKPVVIEFGSYTCPVFRRKVEDIESLRKEFGDSVNWVLIYTMEAHPTDGWAIDINTRDGIEFAQHTSIEERLTCARACSEEMNLAIRVLVDGIDDAITVAYSGKPNRGYVLDAEGVVVSRQVWIDTEETGELLREMTGPASD